jgi:hypothetical protein
MAEEAARVADGGLSNASRSCAGFRRDPTKDATLYEPGGEECGSVPSCLDGRPVAACGAMDRIWDRALPNK